MTAQPLTRPRATIDINQLRRGAIYRAITRRGAATGEYLGMETPYGSRAILLRHRAGTASIAIRDITSIQPAAA